MTKQELKDFKPILEILIKGKVSSKREMYEDFGKQFFKLKTQNGVPTELLQDDIIKKYKLDKYDWMNIISIVQDLDTQHSIDSGMEGKNLERKQRSNNKKLKEIYDTFNLSRQI